MTDKVNLRGLYLDKRRALTNEQVSTWSQLIQQAIIESSAFRNASSVAVYSPIHNEVATEEILRTAWESHKTVALPHWDPRNKTIRFYQVESASPLTRTDWGTREPAPDAAPALSLQQIGLILVPGLVFDRRGYRLGYGQGGYDRILAHYSGQAWGLAFELQLIDSLPHEPHDIPCSRIITEQGFLEVL